MRAGLERLLTERLTAADGTGARYGSVTKVMTVITGMATAANIIDEPSTATREQPYE